jgi:prefoldin subunit 4
LRVFKNTNHPTPHHTVHWTTDCEEKQERLQGEIQELSAEESVIVQKQNTLKKDLYGRFGGSINLEN